MQGAHDQGRPVTRPRRHSLAVRLTHWINALSFAFLLWSGVAILIAFPQFHIGQAGYVGMEPLFALPIRLHTGYTAWGRPLHFAFAWVLVLNGAVYLLHGFASGHFRRDLAPNTAELRPRRLFAELARQLDVRRRHGADEAGYNLIQRLVYLGVIFVLIPLMLLSGLTLSPAVVADQPWLTDIFFGRQTARLVHFLTACGLAAFVVVHLSLVFLSGPVRMIGAMITGRVPHGKADR